MPGTGTWGDVSERLLATCGVTEDPAFYGGYASLDQRAVLTVPQRIMAAWAANDADAFADTFTENGSLLMQDRQLESREEIRAYMSAGFSGPLAGARVTGWPIAVRFLTDDVAVAVTQGGIIMAGQPGLDPATHIRATWVVVRDGDRLALMSHQSSPVAS